MNIPFNVPCVFGLEDKYIKQALVNKKLCGDGFFSHKCQDWFEINFNSIKTLLTPNCTQALEMAAILIDIKPGDEVIMPSYTFVSTANAFVLRGAKIVFVDVRPDTMNINEELIEKAITDKTKAIVPVHYAGVACEMDRIMDIADIHGLFVIEDAAQGVMSTYKGKALGTIGHIGAFSFHETKNYTSGGEGGLLLLNDERFVERAEIIREKGTNRNLFFRGAVDKYSWVDIGSSYLPSELQSAYLWGQLEKADEINEARLSSWCHYNDELEGLEIQGDLTRPTIPKNCTHNAHMYYIKLRDMETRSGLIAHLKALGIQSAFHYIPLHSSKAGLTFSTFSNEDVYTTKHSEMLLRLPLYYGISRLDLTIIIEAVKGFFNENK